jgi:hypothetical protein
MWMIRKEQMQALREPLLARFHLQLLKHVRKHFADETAGESDGEILNHIRHAAGRAAHHGFTSERDVYNYVNISIILGPDFEEAEESQWTKKYLLDRNAAPGKRIDGLHEELLQKLKEEEERGGDDWIL